MATRGVHQASPPISGANAERGNPFITVTALVGLSGAFLALVAAASVAPRVMFLIGAVLCGWSELRGVCGLSHVGTITPLREADKTNRLWLKAAASYTFCGLLTSGLVGFVIGALGSLFGTSIASGTVLVAAALLIPPLFGRSLGWLHFRLPQVHRQTNKFWAFEFGIVPASAMWGAHIGLAFATVIAYGGIFPVTLIAVGSGPIFAMFVFGAFWMGRALPLWIMPTVLARNWSMTPKALQADPYYGYVAAVGLAVIMAGFLIV
jgi:hypothetical protein